MKITLSKLVAVAVFTASSLLGAGAANAYWHHGYWYNTGYYYGGPRVVVTSPGYYGYRTVRCSWVAGHWRNGYWVPGHRVCWRR